MERGDGQGVTGAQTSMFVVMRKGQPRSLSQISGAPTFVSSTLKPPLVLCHKPDQKAASSCPSPPEPWPIGGRHNSGLSPTPSRWMSHTAGKAKQRAHLEMGETPEDQDLALCSLSSSHSWGPVISMALVCVSPPFPGLITYYTLQAGRENSLKTHWDFPESPVADSVLPMQGTQVQSLAGKLRSHAETKSSRDATKTLAQPNK